MLLSPKILISDWNRHALICSTDRDSDAHLVGHAAGTSGIGGAKEPTITREEGNMALSCYCRSPGTSRCRSMQYSTLLCLVGILSLGTLN